VSFVSIHAPARGATAMSACTATTATFQFTLPRGERRFRHFFVTYQMVSIHAPARGATEVGGCVSFDFSGFNSRSREGSDRLH